MLRTIYNTLWYPALPFALTLSGAAGDEQSRRARLGQACGVNGRGSDGLRIWAHAASVGEVAALRPIVTAITGERPGATLVVTTMTAAGRDAAHRTIPGADAHLLAPLDCRRALRPFLAALRPTLVLITETELWPNYFIESHLCGARIAVINGRISQRTFRRYRLLRPLLREMFACADLILTQTDGDAHRFIALGAPPEHVMVTGNTKLAPENLVPPTLRPELCSFAIGCALLVAGSTAPDEEQIVVDAYCELRKRYADLALALAPRHLERAPEIERILRKAKLDYVSASALGSDDRPKTGVLLLDTMGELRSLYSRASVAFVGGSLRPGRGGQSLIEPAAVAVPMIFGPFHDSQAAIASGLIERGAGVVVRDAAGLAQAAAAWLGNEAERIAAGRRARAIVERMTGGVAATLTHLRPLIGAPRNST
jgi:3-deoxy-D-manno-octulosonic-acid transferase